ncbi:hypothetical protein RND71_023214 [Anisodus tanguticus]|uniref:Uncharacterized protein n=1 Tax=Anisodus tanguticus TaxID=243964 RepID=A0AAE1RUQ5_9SOLA|nr:hypothetical protein RND71_023214 [Anisodus tanguticus]
MIDTNTGKSLECYAGSWLPKPADNPCIVEYTASFTVPSDFGRPGAIIVTNFHDKEVHLVQIVIHGFDEGPLTFPANTWIHSWKDDPESRTIFRNQAYLPYQTAPGIRDLRREDLLKIRGNGKGERKQHERVYDYALYNDLGNPNKSNDLARPVFGGDERPYPRRYSFGRPGLQLLLKTIIAQSIAESPHPVYVPRDEAFEEIKQNTLSTKRWNGLMHNLIPAIVAKFSSPNIPFNSFSDIDKLYVDGISLKDENQKENLINQILSAGEKLLKFEIPVIRRDRFAWLRDHEFARQTVAEVNPVSIELLKELPILSKLNPQVYGHPESAITKALIEPELNGMKIEEAQSYGSMVLQKCAFMWISFQGKLLLDSTIPDIPTGFEQLEGMAVEDPTVPCGVKLVIEDYPYAADGLLIWSAINELVESYVE